jgi:DNA (cytosine-5)-methyltransferase 1
MPDFDLLCAGFPCQAFSNAGKRQGFADPRGTLFFEIARVVKERRPAYLLLENVPGLLSHDKGRTFSTILATLCGLGYRVEWQMLNSKSYVPQSRRRVFIIGFLDERCAGKIFPVRETNPKTLIQIIRGPQGSRVYDPEGLSRTLTSGSGGMGGKTGLYCIDLSKNKPKVTDYSRCIKARYNKGLTNRAAECSGVIEVDHVDTVNDPGRLDQNQSQSAVVVSVDNGQEAIDNSGSGAEKKNISDMTFVDMTIGNPKITDHARCITAHYAKSCMSTHDAEKSGVLEADTLFIKEATKRGYKEAAAGDSIGLGYAGSNTRRGRVGKDIAHTLDTGGGQGVITPRGRIRRLTPRECLRLQGYMEDQIDRVLAITSDSQAYKQAGNSVTVNVIHALGLKIRAMHEELTAGGV